MSRRAELQRKLELKAVPKPPADLAQRIKNDIPKELRFNAEDERERFGNSIAMNMGVAASVIVLIATAFLALRIVSRTPMHEGTRIPAVPAKRAIDETPAAPAPLTVSREEQPPSAVPHVTNHERQKKALTEITALDQQANKPKSEAVGTTPQQNTPAPPAPPPPGATAESITVAAAAPVVTADAVAKRSTPSAAPYTSATRQISSDSPVVQHFAAPDAAPQKIALDVEFAAQPLTPGKAVVRASFDAGTLVEDLVLDVQLSDEAKASSRWLAHSFRWLAKTFKGSNTTLVELTIPNVAGDATIAIVRAYYRLPDDSSEQSIEKVIHRSDFETWGDASRRFKGGTLAALWMAGGDAPAIATAAREAGLNDLAATIEKRR